MNRYNPYRDMYMITYLIPSDTHYETHRPTRSFEFSPELVDKPLNVLRKETRDFILTQKPLRAGIVGYMLKIYQDGEWREVYREILVKYKKHHFFNNSNNMGAEQNWMTGAEEAWIKS